MAAAGVRGAEPPAPTTSACSVGPLARRGSKNRPAAHGGGPFLPSGPKFCVSHLATMSLVGSNS